MCKIFDSFPQMERMRIFNDGGMKYLKNLILGLLLLSGISACTTTRSFLKNESNTLLRDSSLRHAHTGIAIYDADKQQYIYRYNSNKYFVPASNTKIPTLYAGMKMLGDSLPSLRYAFRNDTMFVQPLGDPTLLHPDFSYQPVANFLKQQKQPVAIVQAHWRSRALGYGWAWDDYQSAYMAERNPMPVYGNTVRWIQEKEASASADTGKAAAIRAEPPIAWNAHIVRQNGNTFRVERQRDANVFHVFPGSETRRSIEIPFVTDGVSTAMLILQKVLQTQLVLNNEPMPGAYTTLYSQPADSLFRLLMYRSDNFFAEQTLLMVSMQRLGYMNEQKLIDTLLKTDLKGFPQLPRWVDGSGLSRYNLFTPEDFVWLLEKMKNEFGMERLKVIFPTGNTGTLRNFYEDEQGWIFAKTGTLSGHVALSGFLYTQKGRLLIFSVLVNNHNTSAVAVRRAVEKYLKALRKLL